jgi:Domain of unknown function (DUF4259)
LGAWGTRVFDNDTANDWAGDLQGVSDLSLVFSALAELESAADAYLDGDVACIALAACEVLARLLGPTDYRDAYTEKFDAWVTAHPQAVSDALAQRAEAAIARVLRAPSELLLLWGEGGAVNPSWLAGVEDLRQRLRARPAQAKAAKKSPADKRAPKTKKLAVKVGDVFGMDLGEHQWAFARIVNLSDGWDLAEVFVKTARSESSAPPVFETQTQDEVLYPPFHFGIEDVARRKLPVVGRSPVTPETLAYLNAIRFRSGMPGRRVIIQVSAFAPERSATDEESHDLPTQAFRTLRGMVQHVRQILAAGRLRRDFIRSIAK